MRDYENRGEQQEYPAATERRVALCVGVQGDREGGM